MLWIYRFRRSREWKADLEIRGELRFLDWGKQKWTIIGWKWQFNESKENG